MPDDRKTPESRDPHEAVGSVPQRDAPPQRSVPQRDAPQQREVPQREAPPQREVPQRDAPPQERGEARPDGVLESLGKAVSSPVRGAANPEDDRTDEGSPEKSALP